MVPCYVLGGINCIPLQTAATMLERSSIYMTFISKQLDLNDIENPIQYMVTNLGEIFYSPNLYYQYEISFSLTEFEQDDSLLGYYPPPTKTKFLTANSGIDVLVTDLDSLPGYSFYYIA